MSSGGRRRRKGRRHGGEKAGGEEEPAPGASDALAVMSAAVDEALVAQLAHAALVVDEQDSPGHSRHPVGRNTVNVLPAPIRLSTAIHPPCS